MIQMLEVKIELKKVNEEKLAIEFYKKSGDYCDFKKLMTDVSVYIEGFKPSPVASS
jgi:hypothetical protein